MAARDTAGARAVSMYLSIRCHVGGEWKPPTEFSNRQIDRFLRANSKAGNSKISCRVHSVQAAQELKCKGPCGRWRALDDFSKSTRSSGRNWCMDCTSWQLSVEPGFTPYVPPNAVPAPEEMALLNINTNGPPQGMDAGERVEDWIQDNPSEAGGYDGVDVATLPSIIDTESETSGPTLLDDSISGLSKLPQALNAANLSQIGLYDQPGPSSRPSPSPPANPSYASVASAGTVRRGYNGQSGAKALPSGHPGQRAAPRAGRTQSVGVSDALETQSFHSTSAPTFLSGQSESSRSDAVWRENEFLTLGGMGERDENRSGWARPCQRRTHLVTPRYVVNADMYDTQPHHSEAIADIDNEDNYDSDDEC